MGDLRIAIGSGEQRWEGWVPTQRSDLDLLDRSSFERFFRGRLADAMLCEHTWEHLDPFDAVRAAALCRDYLVRGGRLRVAVPDGRFPDEAYQRAVQVGGPGPSDHPAADHKVVYVAETLATVFTEAGFETRLLEWWDDQGVFHVTPWSIDDGPIYRSSLLDHRNEVYRRGQGPPGFTSLIVDCFAP
jgi:predicted SAM-dependent methyltransferase